MRLLAALLLATPAASAPAGRALAPETCAGTDMFGSGVDRRCRELVQGIVQLPRQQRPKRDPEGAQAKQEHVFQKKIVPTAYQTLPDLNAGLFLGAESGGEPREDGELDRAIASDERPPESRKLKAMNSFGSTALFEFVPAEGGSPYGGLFKGGTGILRVSQAGPPRLTGNMPGLALKFFLDGRESVDLVVMNGWSSQGESTNPFLRPMSNALAEPDGPLMKAVKTLLAKLAPGKDPLRSEIAQLAAFDASGKRSTNPKAPYQLILEPTGDDGIPTNTTNDFRADLQRVRPNTALYDVIAVERPGGPRTRVGSIVTRSPFVASEYGDKALSFKHR